MTARAQKRRRRRPVLQPAPRPLPGWEPVEAGEGDDRHVVYWHRPVLPRGRYLTVALDTFGRWGWAVRGPDRLPNRQGGAFRAHATGVAEGLVEAQTAAEDAARAVALTAVDEAAELADAIGSFEARRAEASR